MTPVKQTFGKKEKLKSKITLERTFTQGQKIKAYPIIARHTESSHSGDFPFQVATTVSKRKFRKAVSRNRIKRLMREAWRLQKHKIESLWVSGDAKEALIFLYIGNHIPTFEECMNNIGKIVDVLVDRLNKIEGEKQKGKGA